MNDGEHMTRGQLFWWALIIALCLLVLFGWARTDAAPATGTGPGYCYGAQYSGSIDSIRATGLKGIWSLTVTTAHGDTYTLRTTRGCTTRQRTPSRHGRRR